MEKYNFGKFDPFTLEKEDFYVDIPKLLVETIIKALAELPEGLMASPQMWNPKDGSLVYSVLEKDEQENWVNKYEIIIKTKDGK